MDKKVDLVKFAKSISLAFTYCFQKSLINLFFNNIFFNITTLFRKQWIYQVQVQKKVWKLKSLNKLFTIRIVRKNRTITILKL